MRKEIIEILFKCSLTGFIYAFITCIVQVPIANVLFSILDLQSDTSISNEMLISLLLSLFAVGMAMARFYYLHGKLFQSKNMWMQGMKFGLFVYLSNYIPQVFFLDAKNGLQALINGGFPVIQVELFDLIILMLTVLLMVIYMPYRQNEEYQIQIINHFKWWKYLLIGIVFAAVLILLQEIILPALGIQGMADGLNVSKENRLFFYGVMVVGFVFAGILVSYYTLKSKHNNKNAKEKFCLEYGIFIWCAFDLTMIPLGFGMASTLIFIIVSLIGFAIMNILCNSPSK